MKPNYILTMEQGFKNSESDFTLEDVDTYVYLNDYDEYVIESGIPNMYVVYDIYMFLINRGLKVSDILLHISSYCETIGISNIDLRQIQKIKRHVEKNNLRTDIMIDYDYVSIAELDEFLMMSECIKWYRSIIKENKLSPFEILMYAYDIAKTFKYTRSGKSSTDITHDNTLHLIIKTGNIVCYGYNKLMKEIINGLDSNLVYDEFTTYCYGGKKNVSPECHSRGIVRIDDSKYNIHGIYICDPTWDSVRDEFKDIDGYSSFSGYRYFMVPISKYRRFFKGDTYPRFFNGELFGFEKRLTSEQLRNMSNNPNICNKYLINMEGINYHNFKLLYNPYMTYKDLIGYLNCERPDIEDFIDAIVKVRKCEGFSSEDISGSLVYGVDVDDKDHGYYLNVSKPVEKKLVL